MDLGNPWMAKRRRSKRWIWGLVFCVLIVGAIVVAVMIKNSFDTSNERKEAATEKSSGQNQTEDEQDGVEPSDEQNVVKKEEVPQYAGDNPNNSEVLTGVISYANVINDELVIRVNIDQFLSEGSCGLSITRNGAKLYTQSVQIIGSVSTSTCDGFKVPIGETLRGNLQIDIELESSNKRGNITGKVKV